MAALAMASTPHALLLPANSRPPLSHALHPNSLLSPGLPSLPSFRQRGHLSPPHPPTFIACSQSTESSSDANRPQQEQEQITNTPSWAQPGSDVPPPWERKQAASQPGFQVPFFVYLLASTVVAIAAVGSIFEYFNKNPVFGVIYPDSPLYTPILGFFAFAGLPCAAFLWFKSIELANKAARDQDREDGYSD